MARIAGVNVSDNKHTEIALTAIYGIGRVTAKKICDATGIAATTKIKDLSDADLEKLRDHIGVYIFSCLFARPYPRNKSPTFF